MFFCAFGYEIFNPNNAPRQQKKINKANYREKLINKIKNNINLLDITSN